MTLRQRAGPWVAAGLLAGAWSLPLAHSQEESVLTEDEIVLKEEAGHRIMLPKDWPIERKDGVIQPVDLIQYLSMKFGQVRQQFTRTDQRLVALETRVAALESERAILLRRLQALEERAALEAPATAMDRAAPERR